MTIDRIDHVHIEVENRETAAQWYRETLGLTPHAQFLHWAEDPQSPLILALENGDPALALFARACKAPSRDATIAFRVSGTALLAFLDRLPALGLTATKGGILTRGDLVDHYLSWSLYFLDPDQNRIELTSYDYDLVAQTV